MKEKALICVCCGGTINRLKMQCEYCGTQYEENNNNLIRIETYHNPIKHIAASTIIPRELERVGGVDYNKFIITELAHKLSEQMLDCMKFTNEYNPGLDSYEVRADVKLIIPQNCDTPPYI